ncbi:hypothetical protein Cgig2_012161 [Carnegiea gigantea]|uniref:RRM domain-containing protein n=1 Tax=Carnegiea gigantea TaxID=171969 RepID=A0A9Q1KTT1_9CARY|nr:hypothetical protein Cgig2_012161 [Carnegiea gigantea]
MASRLPFQSPTFFCTFRSYPRISRTADGVNSPLCFTLCEDRVRGDTISVRLRRKKEERKKMEEQKKRKLDELQNGEAAPTPSEEHLRSLLDPLAKSQLVDLLAKLGSKYSPVAGEIMNLASADPVHRKLFVRGLAWNTTSETLCAAFAVHGEIEEGAVIYDKATGKSRGYGFITYKSMESSQNALKAPSKLIDGRLAACNLASEGLSSASTTPDQAQRKLYVGGLSPETTTAMLLNFFMRHGEIEEGSVAYDKDTNKSRGFGFVTYKTVEAAKKALDDPERTLGVADRFISLAWSKTSGVDLSPQIAKPMQFMRVLDIMGRNITVKYADMKSKTTPNQLPPVVPGVVPPPVGSGYLQSGKNQGPPAPLGYGYGQPAPSYQMPPSYPSPPSGHTPAPYPYPSQNPYAPPPPPVPLKKDGIGMPPPMSAGMPGYPYYMARQ